MKRYYIDLDDSLRRSANHLEGEREREYLLRRCRGSAAPTTTITFPPAARRAARRSIRSAKPSRLRFATEKKGAKAGPFVNKIFESSLEGAEQKVQQLEDADAASAEGAQPLSIIADCLMMIVAWLFYFIKIEWLDEREESGGHAAKKHRASTSTARVVARTATTTVPAKANECLKHCLALLSAQWCFARPFSPDSRVNVIRAPHSPHSSRARARTGTT